MIKTFEFYFDFASPYTFFAHKEIKKIARRQARPSPAYRQSQRAAS